VFLVSKLDLQFSRCLSAVHFQRRLYITLNGLGAVFSGGSVNYTEGYKLCESKTHASLNNSWVKLNNLWINLHNNSSIGLLQSYSWLPIRKTDNSNRFIIAKVDRALDWLSEKVRKYFLFQNLRKYCKIKDNVFYLIFFRRIWKKMWAKNSKL